MNIQHVKPIDDIASNHNNPIWRPKKAKQKGPWRCIGVSFKIVFREDNILKSVTSIQVVLTFNQGLIHVSEIGNWPLLTQILDSDHSEKITNFYYAVLVLF